jgi:hypothetical protein
VEQLIKSLNQRTDDGKLLKAAVEPSRLSPGSQKLINEILEESDGCIEAKTANELRAIEKGGIIEHDPRSILKCDAPSAPIKRRRRQTPHQQGVTPL